MAEDMWLNDKWTFEWVLLEYVEWVISNATHQSKFPNRQQNALQFVEKYSDVWNGMKAMLKECTRPQIIHYLGPRPAHCHFLSTAHILYSYFTQHEQFLSHTLSFSNSFLLWVSQTLHNIPFETTSWSHSNSNQHRQ